MDVNPILVFIRFIHNYNACYTLFTKINHTTYYIKLNVESEDLPYLGNNLLVHHRNFATKFSASSGNFVVLLCISEFLTKEQKIAFMALNQAIWTPYPQTWEDFIHVQANINFKTWWSSAPAVLLKPHIAVWHYLSIFIGK